MFLTRPFILLIDDDNDDNEMLSEIFISLGIETKSFVTGENALRYLTSMEPAAGMPSLIILDYNMPARNGLEILSAIKTNPGAKNIPVIMYSTSISPLLQKKLMQNGANACYIKPSRITEAKVQAKIFAMLARNFSRANEQEKYSDNRA